MSVGACSVDSADTQEKAGETIPVYLPNGDQVPEPIAVTLPPNDAQGTPGPQEEAGGDHSSLGDETLTFPPASAGGKRVFVGGFHWAFHLDPKSPNWSEFHHHNGDRAYDLFLYTWSGTGVPTRAVPDTSGNAPASIRNIAVPTPAACKVQHLVTDLSRACGLGVYLHCPGAGQDLGHLNDRSANVLMCHFANLAVREGQQIEPGDVIGIQGDTGSASWSSYHVHIQFAEKSPQSDNFILAMARNLGN